MKKKLKMGYLISVLKVLNRMGSLQKRKFGKTVFLVKDGVEFARITRSKLDLLNPRCSLYEFKDDFNIQGDTLLRSATESYWVASGRKTSC